MGGLCVCVCVCVCVCMCVCVCVTSVEHVYSLYKKTINVVLDNRCRTHHDKADLC